MERENEKESAGSLLWGYNGKSVVNVSPFVFLFIDEDNSFLLRPQPTAILFWEVFQVFVDDVFVFLHRISHSDFRHQLAKMATSTMVNFLCDLQSYV
jgi:hypothetical protein